jgi:predicted aspartyl protease
MGTVYAEIELINGRDHELAKTHHIGEDEVRRITVTGLVDSGAMMLCINENIQEYLQIPVTGSKKAQLANREIINCPIVSPVEFRFKNRSTTCRAMVLPGDSEILIGVIPLEDIDVVIDQVHRELIVHPDRPDIPLVRI